MSGFLWAVGPFLVLLLGGGATLYYRHRALTAEALLAGDRVATSEAEATESRLRVENLERERAEALVRTFEEAESEARKSTDPAAAAAAIDDALSRVRRPGGGSEPK